MKIDNFPIEYDCPDTLAIKNHHVLIAILKDKDVMLSHANLYLRDNTSGSLKTSRPYAINIANFYKYLSKTEKMKGIHVSKYHILADNQDIRRWQVQRQIDRVNKQNQYPTSETIYNDAKKLLQFFLYLHDKGYATCVNVETKKWIANFKNRTLLSYIQKKAKVVIDASNVETLDKERRQRKLKSLITDQEIVELIQAYPDPVFAVMFNLGLGTAIRPQEICSFPYIGSGDNTHVKPYSDMDKRLVRIGKTEYSIYRSKDKDRTISIPMAELLLLEKTYTDTLYPERKKKYEKIYGKPCPPSILFLDKDGDPVTETKISNATLYAKELAMKKNPGFRKGVNFYENRHWWPTQVIIDFYGDLILTEKVDVLDAALGQVIINQMGHNEISTTFKNYIDTARVIMLSDKGLGNEVFTSQETAIERIKRLNKSRLNNL